MKGLDTNVLVRYLVQDDPTQAGRANRYIERHCTGDSQCLINNIVLCELVWVLESAYGYKKEIVAEALEKLFTASGFEFEDKNIVWTALNDYRTRKVDLADCLIGRKNRAAGCDETVTFDKALKQLDGFKLL